MLIPDHPAPQQEEFAQAHILVYDVFMSSIRYVYWQDEGMWLGHLEEYPDYMSQGETLEELKENLKDLYVDLSSGDIPGIKRVAQLTIP